MLQPLGEGSQTAAGFPLRDAQSFCSTEIKNASMSMWRMIRSSIGRLVLTIHHVLSAIFLDSMWTLIILFQNKPLYCEQFLPVHSTPFRKPIVQNYEQTLCLILFCSLGNRSMSWAESIYHGILYIRSRFPSIIFNNSSAQHSRIHYKDRRDENAFTQ